MKSYPDAMFDAHAHPGKPSSRVLACCAKEADFPLMKAFPHRAYGLLWPRQGSIEVLRKALEDDPTALIGEVGLDERFPIADEGFLMDALLFAKELHRPFTLHVVGLHTPVLWALKTASPLPPFIVHGFTSSYETARRYVDLGGLISLGPRSERTRSFTRLLTLPFVLETDMETGPAQEKALAGLHGRVAERLGKDVEHLEEEIHGRIEPVLKA